jgi:hypothetical protein
MSSRMIGGRGTHLKIGSGDDRVLLPVKVHVA